MESETQLIANKAAWADTFKQQKIQNLAMMLNGAINALSQVGLMLNVPKASLDAVLAVLPALSSPTVSHLQDSEWVAVNTILDENHRPRRHPQTQSSRRQRHRRIPPQQGRSVTCADVGKKPCFATLQEAERLFSRHPLRSVTNSRGINLFKATR